MLPQPAPAPQSPRRCGVGIDTARYGHYAVFLTDDLQPAAPELQFPESAAGYAALRQRLERITQQHGPVHFVVRLDVAGPYAENLLHFWHGLGPAGGDTAAAPAPFTLTLSGGDPQRNKNYRRSVQRRGPRWPAARAADPAAGHTPDPWPAEKVVTAAGADSVAEATPVGEGTYLDFAHLQRQLPLARVLDQLGLSARLRGHGPQRRCACPLHRGDARGRTFSVNLDANVFQCFDKQCARKGDVIDLWAAVHGLSLREAALDLVRTFGLEPAPRSGTEKRHG
jgi:hypothetical protein